MCVKFATSQFFMLGVSGGKSTYIYIYVGDSLLGCFTCVIQFFLFVVVVSFFA